jgi:hypothetical protein
MGVTTHNPSPGPVIEARAMGRLFLLWRRPPGLSLDDAHTWAQRQTWAVRQGGLVESAELVRLRAPGRDHPLWHDWMLVVQLTTAELDAPIEDEPSLRELVAELRSLGMRPVALQEAG